MNNLLISSSFDGGAIIVDNIDHENNKVSVRLKPDPFTKHTDNCQHAQWFYFKCSNLNLNKQTSFELIHLDKDCSYAEGWPDYKTVYSYDLENWFRVQNTTYDKQLKEGTLAWSIQAEQSQIYFAYFAPYTYQRHQDLISKCQLSNLATVVSLGHTLDGRDLDLVKFGKGPLKIWICCRQHPGESMAEWYAEGLLERLLVGSDPFCKQLLEACTLYVVPNMNPDGTVRGHLRTNKVGSNLNREWNNTGNYEAPTLERSPEVFYVLSNLDKIGCDFYLDIHGDEEIPGNFLASTSGIPGWNDRLQGLFDKFQNALLVSSPDHQTKLGYPLDEPGKANLAICADAVAQRFNCLAVTLEQPYKDCLHNPMPHVGWSPSRSKAFGAATLDAILKVVPDLSSSKL